MKVCLALQGGGAHGAFTWGVLDRLLDVPGLDIAAVSGTSAGALNGAALKAGLVAGGPVAAQKRLARFWDDVAGIGDFRSLPLIQPFLPVLRFWQEAAEAFLPVSPQGIAAQLWSPYAVNVENPLAPVIRDLDFRHVCADEGPRLFVGATNVRTGKARIFKGAEIGPEVLMASACIPAVFRAVEIGGEAYWDGGFSGNPALWPLYEPDLPEDVIIVQVNPLRREAVPDTPIEIQNRVNEISFNAALLGELRAVAFVRRLIAEGRMPKGAMKDVRIHMISDDALMNELSASSKLQPSDRLIQRLKTAGRAAADRFLTEHGSKVGHEGSVDLAALYG